MMLPDSPDCDPSWSGQHLPWVANREVQCNLIQRSGKELIVPFVWLKPNLGISLDFVLACNALGPSKIPAWAIKDAKAALAKLLCYLINQRITEGKSPEDLKKACITPLFKKGNPKDPLNSRPISVTSALAKIFEKAFRSQITSFREMEQLLFICQFGYRKRISTIDTILKSTEKIRLELNKKKMLLVRF